MWLQPQYMRLQPPVHAVAGHLTAARVAVEEVLAAARSAYAAVVAVELPLAHVVVEQVAGRTEVRAQYEAARRALAARWLLRPAPRALHPLDLVRSGVRSRVQSGEAAVQSSAARRGAVWQWCGSGVAVVWQWYGSGVAVVRCSAVQRMLQTRCRSILWANDLSARFSLTASWQKRHANHSSQCGHSTRQRLR